jgi:hypothetical protein
MTIKAGNGTHQNKHDYFVRKLNYFNKKQNSKQKQMHVELLHWQERNLNTQWKQKLLNILLERKCFNI